MTRQEYNANPTLCLMCGKGILAEEGQILSNIKRKKFCNQSCAATYNNAQRQKKGYYCSKCNGLIGYGFEQFGARKYCDKCNPNKIDWGTVSYKDAKDKRSYQVNSRIRELARKNYLKSDAPKKCTNCGYDKHYEVCHIKPISSYEDEDTITTINELNNLVALCPNCHWELDHGLLKL